MQSFTSILYLSSRRQNPKSRLLILNRHEHVTLAALRKMIRLSVEHNPLQCAEIHVEDKSEEAEIGISMFGGLERCAGLNPYNRRFLLLSGTLVHFVMYAAPQIETRRLNLLVVETQSDL